MRRTIDAAKMTSHWTFWLIVSGLAYVSGNQCDVEDVRACYDDLVNYETIIFPLYGENEDKLDETCGNINMSITCVMTFLDACHESVHCDEECQNFSKEIHNFIAITGLTKLADNLCKEGNALRQIYLENVECIRKNADNYASCHNDSQASQHYLQNKEPNIEDNCCYITWYQNCFINTTRENCGENATLYVSIAAHNLLGNIADQLCGFVPITCDRPPLPPDGFEDRPDDSDLDKDKPDKIDNDIDNSLDKPKSFESSATFASYSITLSVLSCIFTVL